ncbi:MAG: hypothetical protein CVU38_13965 [Chloroflexi bacterium HGW-Chloroflexi-1]|nr:MAG: hypothetical protein CVU38_13965 [Chloroflexi bacterium HGW-Chloroflexi-1]
MSAVMQVFEGHDLVIPGDVVTKLGIKPGEFVMICPVPDLRPVEYNASERARRLHVLDALWASWTDEDELFFEKARQEMWSSWPTHSLS